MAHLEVQGIVAVADGLPYVQIHQLDDKGNIEAQIQLSSPDARDFAHSVVEASVNAIYDAALLAWAKEVSPENPDLGLTMVWAIRQYRSDKWGLPDQPQDWRI